MELTQERVKELFDYDPEVGVLIRKIDVGKKVKAGQVAGSISTSDGYRYIRVEWKLYPAHRLIWLWMTGVYVCDGKEIDHIDGVRDNNKLSNIRVVTKAENARNTKRYSSNTSGFSGVCFDKRRKVWYSRIKVNHRDVYLGSSPDINVSIKLRKDAEVKYGYHPNHGRN